MDRVKFFFVGAILLHLLSYFFPEIHDSNILRCEPITLGTAALLGGVSLGNTLLGNVLGRSNADKSAALQKDLMQYEYDNFTSPSAIARGLAKAGINPLVAFSNGSYSQASPSVSAPQVSPVDVGLSGNDLTNMVLAMAQAKKAGADTVGKEIENQVNKALVDTRIKQAAADLKFTQEQTTRVKQEYYKIIGEQRLLEKENEIKKIDVEKHKDLVDSVLQHYKDQHSLDEQQFKALEKQLPVVLKKLQAEQKILDVDAQIAGDFKQTMASLGAVGQAVQVISKLVSIFK